ncbi:MAG: hypothetical protein DRR06_15130, partial [Gammaproteobacteria bacterium]
MFKTYSFMVVGALLLMTAVNMMELSFIGHDTVNMRIFMSGLLSSPGFMKNLGFFVAAVLFVHALWLLALWVITAGWMTRVSAD